MRTLHVILLVCLLTLAAGCTTARQQDRPKVLCPACNSEVDAVIHKHF